MPKLEKHDTIESSSETKISSSNLDEIFDDLGDEDTVSVMNLRPMKVYYVGKNTGRTYVFDGAGSIVDDVDKIDAEEMVTLPVTPSCCGSFPTPYFQIVGR